MTAPRMPPIRTPSGLPAEQSCLERVQIPAAVRLAVDRDVAVFAALGHGGRKVG
jgi:hypothetical protein